MLRDFVQPESKEFILLVEFYNKKLLKSSSNSTIFLNRNALI
jgi:hypothetical protein